MDTSSFSSALHGALIGHMQAVLEDSDKFALASAEIQAEVAADLWQMALGDGFWRLEGHPRFPARSCPCLARSPQGERLRMTHFIELRRADGGKFTAAEAEPVLVALHFGVSLALGRWAAPVVPVGPDASGKVGWESWTVGHCAPRAEPKSRTVV